MDLLFTYDLNYIHVTTPSTNRLIWVTTYAKRWK